MRGSYKKIFSTVVSWYQQLLVTSCCLYCHCYKPWHYLLPRRLKYSIYSGKIWNDNESIL